MDKTSYEEVSALEKEKRRKLVEKLKADTSEILFYVKQLKVIQKHNDMVEANTNKRSRELELNEKELLNSRSDLDKRVKVFEKEKSEAGNLKILVEESREELRLKRNELTSKLDASTRIQREIELKKKQLGQYIAEFRRLCSEADKVQNRKKEMEEEIDRKKNELSMILVQIKESGKQFVKVDEQLEMKSLEVVSKEEELERVRESIKLSGQEIDSKSKELGKLQKLIEQQTSGLGVMQNQLDSIRLLVQEQSEELVSKEKRHKEILETICRSSSELEERDKEVSAAKTEVSYLTARSDRLRQEVEDKEKELNMLKNQKDSEEKKLVKLNSEMEEETDRKKEDLVLILSKIEDSSKQLAAVDKQLESQGRLLEIKSVELVSTDMELECVRESCKCINLDLLVKEKRVEALNNLMTISSEQLDLKSKELEKIQRELELKKQLRQRITMLVKCEKQPDAASITDTSEQNAEETEDALMHHDILASLTRQEVSSVLKALPNPAEYVLELVQEDISEGSGLQDSFVEILVLLFEELSKIQQSDKSQMQLRATKVATLWKEKITIEAPKSSLEALAFLLFIVAYGLKTLLSEEETALLASSIAQYEQAPRLFNSLSLNPRIREFVKELIKKSQYIPAVRIICLFKLNKEFSFSPSELLKEEIIKLRRSALENRSTGSSQAKDKDAGRLRAILELVADYNIEIDLPGDLIVKLMLQRKSLAPLVVAQWIIAPPLRIHNLS